MKTRPLIRRCAAAAALAVLAWPVQAADDPSPPAKAADKLGAVRTQIAAKNFAGAIDALKKINDTGSADWNNLMGYSLRKNTPPDVAGAEKFYDSALRIDPKHRGALEYSGELYLMKGDLTKAQSRLASLQSECGGKCEQYAELKTAIADYQANGNKYVSKGW